MTADIFYLALTCILSLVMWIPYILGRIGAWGLIDAMGYPENPPAQPAWALRLKAAHANLTENLAPFAGLVLAAHVAGLANETTALGSLIFFVARVIHAFSYWLGLPFVRTVAFAGGWVGCLMVASVFILM